MLYVPGGEDDPTVPEVPVNPIIPIIPVVPPIPDTPEIPTPAVPDEPLKPEEEPIVWTNPFADLDETEAQYESIAFVYEKKLFIGVSDNAFASDMEMTRAMLVTVLGRHAGIDPTAYTGVRFEDVETDAWYAPYVAWAVSEGIVSGYADGTFGVNRVLTVEETAIIFASYAKYSGIATVTEQSLADYLDTAAVSSNAMEAIKWMLDSGLYICDDGYLRPQMYVKRAYAAAIMHAYVEKFDK